MIADCYHGWLALACAAPRLQSWLISIRLLFSAPCDIRASALRRDECGDWAIFGDNGHIYAVPEGFQLMIGCDPEPRWSSARGWESAKKRLASYGCVTQDGDEEGSIIADRLPTPEEAVEIRYVLGIAKRVEYSEETLAAKRAQALMARKLSPIFLAKNGL